MTKRNGLGPVGWFRPVWRTMRLSIRNQILIPLIGIQAVALTAATITLATLAATRTEREIIGRLNDVLDTLGRGDIPYTASVLAKLRGLSGAHFIVARENGTIMETSLPKLDRLPESLLSVPQTAQVTSLQDYPAVVLDGTPYFAVSVPARAGPVAGSLVVLYPETSLRQARREAVMPSLLWGFGSLGVMAIVSGLIAQRISARIRTVERQVARIAAGDFQELANGGRQDEVGDLTFSINRMCSQLRGMRQMIHDSERARLLAQLAAGLAHQLRNSLTGARMSIQLHARRHPAPFGDETLSVALRQLELTEEQVKGLLSAGRLERRPPVICDLGQLLEEVARLVDPACQHARVTLHRESQTHAGSAGVLADRSSLRVAILNLALNAIDAAGPGGTVSLAARQERDQIAVDVVDNGPGPPPEIAETLCEPFVTSKPEGVGLGLMLAQQVAADHGGRLSWNRTGGETRFSLSFPTTNGVRKEAE
jgi:signal transduction histidine kinase